MNDRLLQFFAYDHLPPHLRKVSEPFCTLAHQIVNDIPSNAERTVALRKLLEAKDCAVRAMLEVQETKPNDPIQEAAERGYRGK